MRFNLKKPLIFGLMAFVGISTITLAQADSIANTGYVTVPYHGKVSADKSFSNSIPASENKTPESELEKVQKILDQSHSPYKEGSVVAVHPFVKNVKLVIIKDSGVAETIYLIDNTYIRSNKTPVATQNKGLSCTQITPGPKANIHVCHQSGYPSFWIIGNPKNGSALGLNAKDGYN